MTKFFKISAYNTNPVFFWGTSENADRYVHYLNRDRENNVFSATTIPAAEWAEYENRDDVLSGEEPYWDDFMNDDQA